MLPFLRRHWPAILILAAALSLQLLGAIADGPTADEAVHLSAGVSYLQTGDFRMNPEHPPLVKLLAGLPVLLSGGRVETGTAVWNAADKWIFGSQFLFENEHSPDRLILLGRLPMVALTMTFLAFVYLWLNRRFGPWPALTVLAVLSFDPTILGHGHLVTTDVAAAFAFLLTLIALERYLNNASGRNAWLLAFVIAVAQIIKFSLVILWLIVPVVYLVRWWYDRRRKTTPLPWSLTRLFALLGKSALVFLVLTFVCYGFEIRKPIDDPIVQQLYEKRAQLAASHTYNTLSLFEQRFIATTDPATRSGQRLQKALQLPVPAYSYLSGLIAVTSHNYTGHSHSFLGKTGDHGSIFYFPLGWVVKTPFGIFALTLIGLGILLRNNIFRASFTPILFSLAGLIYLLSALTSNLNIGYRHVLPLLPLLAGLVAIAVLQAFKSPSPWKKGISVGLLLFGLLSPLRSLPHMISFYSELIGGTKNGHVVMLDSNLDWGQVDREASNYVRANGITLQGTTKSGPDDRGYYGFSQEPVPRDVDLQGKAPTPGYYLITANALRSGSHSYRWLETRQPYRVFGGVLALYHIP